MDLLDAPARKQIDLSADAHYIWQRGSTVNFNWLLRQYIPKKRHMETITDEGFNIIQEKLNHRLSIRLGFKSPYEVFQASLNRVAIVLEFIKYNKLLVLCYFLELSIIFEFQSGDINERN